MSDEEDATLTSENSGDGHSFDWLNQPRLEDEKTGTPIVKSSKVIAALDNIRDLGLRRNGIPYETWDKLPLADFGESSKFLRKAFGIGFAERRNEVQVRVPLKPESEEEQFFDLDCGEKTLRVRLDPNSRGGESVCQRGRFEEGEFRPERNISLSNEDLSEVLAQYLSKSLTGSRSHTS